LYEFMKNLTGIILCLAGLFLIFSCSSESKETTPKTGDYKPFEITQLNGEIFHSDSLASKVVLVDYWATWCKPCIWEIPGYSKLYMKYKDKNFIFLPICMDSGDADKIKPFIKEHGISYPVYVGNSRARTAFGDIPGYPTTIILDKNGQIRDKYVGVSPTKIEEIDVTIGSLLSEKATQ